MNAQNNLIALRASNAPAQGIGVRPALDAHYPLNVAASGCPEMFLISGLGGHVLPFKKLGKHLSEDVKVTGLLYPYLTGDTRNFTTIDSYATYFDDLLSPLETQEIFLFGYSKGGAIAFELARHLKRKGHNVGVILLDTSIRSLQKRKRSWKLYLRDYKRRLRRYLTGLAAVWRNDQAEIVKWHSFRALLRYKPASSSVPTVLIKPTIAEHHPWFEESDDLGWGQVANLIAILETPGEHLNTFKGENAQHLAVTIRRAIDTFRADDQHVAEIQS